MVVVVIVVVVVSTSPSCPEEDGKSAKRKRHEREEMKEEEEIGWPTCLNLLNSQLGYQASGYGAFGRQCNVDNCRRERVGFVGQPGTGSTGHSAY